MKLLDSANISFFNMRSHLKRTCLTIFIEVILFIFTLIILFCAVIGSFHTKNTILNEFIHNGTQISYYATQNSSISQEEYIGTKKVINDSNFDYKLKDTKYSAIIKELGINVDIVISESTALNNILISDGLFNYVTAFTDLEVGEEVSFALLIGDLEYELVGEIDAISNDSQRLIIMSYDFAFTNGIPVYSGLYYDILGEDISFSVLNKRLLNISKEFSCIENIESDNYSNPIYESYIIQYEFGLKIIIPIAIILCFILILLMLGSIINSLLFNIVEKERFFRICIVHGLTDKMVNLIVMIECFITSFIASLVSVVVLFILRKNVNSISISLWQNFISLDLNSISSTYFPIWLVGLLWLLVFCICEVFTVILVKRLKRNNLLGLVQGEVL